MAVIRRMSVSFDVILWAGQSRLQPDKAVKTAFQKKSVCIKQEEMMP